MVKNNYKIFGIGLSRTGTTSLHHALKILGFKSIHNPFILYKSKDFSILDEYDAFVDSPIPLMFKDLDRMYPGSKFILTTRSLESWLSSMKWMFKHGSALWKASEKAHKYRKEFFGCEKFDEAILEKKYYDFHEDVIRYFKERKDDLLILDIERNANFENLCSFLRLPILKSEYPKSHKRRYVPLRRRLIYHYIIRTVQKIRHYFE